MSLVLKFKTKPAAPCERSATILRFKPKHAAGVPDAALPFLQDLAAMVAADVVREVRKPKLKLKFKDRTPEFPA